MSREGAGDPAGDDDIIQVVSRAFDVLRCFDGHDARLGNLEISSRCGLPRSTVSRLTHTLTRMGQLVYLPNDQKYRIGPSAVAMSTSLLRGLQLRNLIRMRLQDVAEKIPGTIGFLLPDRFHLVYFEFARADHALGLHSSTGSRIAIARTAGGHAFMAALDEGACNALLADMEREIPGEAQVLRTRMAANRTELREHGYVTVCGLWSQHINGIAVPLWSPQFKSHVVVNIGLLSTMYDEARLHNEVAPRLLELSRAIGSLIDNADSGCFDTPGLRETRATRIDALATDGRARQPDLQQKGLHQKGLQQKDLQQKDMQQQETSLKEDRNDLAARTRRPRAPRSLRAGDGRR